MPGERRDCVDEINIVDTGSTDRTIEIARAFGANVIHREWRNDFGWARNEALALATRRWTLVSTPTKKSWRSRSRCCARCARCRPI